MDKSWMNLHRLDPRFKDGVDKFLDFAFSKTREDTIPCPCKKCANRYPLKRDIVESHMIVKGILPNYVNWTHHGEPYVSPWQATPEGVREQNSLSRSFLDMLPTTGSRPFAALRKDIVEKTGMPVHEGKFFAATRKRKDETFSDEKAKKAVEQMAEIEEQYTEEDGTCSVDTAEIVAAVVGPDKKGRRRLHGRTEPKPKRGGICQATLQSLREELRAEMREEMREMNRQWDARVREAQEEARREVRREREQHQSQFPESVQAALAMLLATLPPHLRVPSSSGSQPGTCNSGRPTEDGGQQ